MEQKNIEKIKNTLNNKAHWSDNIGLQQAGANPETFGGGGCNFELG